MSYAPKNDEMGRERINDLIAFIVAGSQPIEMTSWVVEASHECGNTACIVGNLSFLPSFVAAGGERKRGYRITLGEHSYEEAASVFLGLPLDVCQMAFNPSGHMGVVFSAHPLEDIYSSAQSFLYRMKVVDTYLRMRDSDTDSEANVSPEDIAMYVLSLAYGINTPEVFVKHEEDTFNNLWAAMKASEAVALLTGLREIYYGS